MALYQKQIVDILSKFHVGECKHHYITLRKKYGLEPCICQTNVLIYVAVEGGICKKGYIEGVQSKRHPLLKPYLVIHYYDIQKINFSHKRKSLELL